MEDFYEENDIKNQMGEEQLKQIWHYEQILMQQIQYKQEK